MLWQLNIKNLAIIDDISIEFTDGFNILTGETGAGKSIIIDAINLVLGARADRELIRTGENAASVDAVFTVDGNEKLTDALRELDIFDEDESELFISRQVYSNGRNVNRINGKPVPINTLKDISELLIDIHGQHQHQSLLNKAYHMGFLDSFDGEIQYVQQKVSKLYYQWRELVKKIEEIDTGTEDFERNKELMEYQISEIEDADLKIGEDDELAEKKQLLKNSKAIIEALEYAYVCLNSAKRDGGAIDLMRTAKDKLRDISDFSEEYSELYDTADTVYYELEDLSDQIRKSAKYASFAPDELEKTDDRLYLINSLKRKYGKTIENVLAFKDNLKEQLASMEYNMDNLEQLRANEKALYTSLIKECDILHEKREQAAKRLQERIVDELRYLGMKKVSFCAEITVDKDNVSPSGYDSVEFLISTNPGEPMKPLAKIASGGEVSRIMLSIKSALAEIDGIPTMIFDEIDTGISGAVARAAGEKMYALSRSHQIICITHQAQIAALADSHFYVSKTQNDGKTVTNVKLLEECERIEHIASMISGSTVTDAARQHARELMKY